MSWEWERIISRSPSLNQGKQYRLQCPAGDLVWVVAFISEMLIITMFLSIFTSSLFWKLVDLKLCFLLRTPRVKHLQILFPVYEFQTERLAVQQWEEAMEWLRKQQHIHYKKKGKKMQLSPLLLFTINKTTTASTRTRCKNGSSTLLHTNSLLEQRLELQPC